MSLVTKRVVSFTANIIINPDFVYQTSKVGNIASPIVVFNFLNQSEWKRKVIPKREDEIKMFHMNHIGQFDGRRVSLVSHYSHSDLIYKFTFILLVNHLFVFLKCIFTCLALKKKTLFCFSTKC